MKAIFLFLIFTITIVSIGCASAADIGCSDLSDSSSLQDVSLDVDDSIADADYELSKDSSIIEDIPKSNEKSNLNSSSAGSFTDLNNAVNGNENNTIFLNRDYVYTDSDSDFKKGIVINRSLTIYGNGVTIDGSNIAHMFNIDTLENVVLYDINFINGHASTFGGAIYGTCTAVRCSFKNNQADIQGGALYYGDAVDCTFINNKAGHGGAMFAGIARTSSFTNNSAENGGALDSTTAYRCRFEGNVASIEGGAMYRGNADNSIFLNNSAESGGALSYSNAGSSYFINNSALLFGGAFKLGNATDCLFANNTAGRLGGAMMRSNASYCLIYGNSKNGGQCYQSNLVSCTVDDDLAAILLDSN